MSSKPIIGYHKIAARLAVVDKLLQGVPRLRRTGAKYPGVLNEPVLVRGDDDGLSVAEQESAERELYEQLLARLEALYKHHNIDPCAPEAAAQLVFALAHTHVPGFSYVLEPKKGRGAPRKWRGVKGLGLLADVIVLTRNGATASNACRILATSAKYSSRYKGETPKNLYRRYQEFKSLGENLGNLGRVFEQARADGHPTDDWLAESYSIDAVKRQTQSGDVGGKSELKSRTTK